MKNKLKFRNIILFSISIFTVISCEEVINVDLNSSSPRITVQAVITDLPGPYFVKLSKSESFFNSNDSFPPVKDAMVIISDNTGIIDSLSEIEPGIYKTSIIKGINGRTYHLKINDHGNVYEADSYLPMPVKLDTITYQKITETGPRSKENNKFYIKCHFLDPVNEKDFYRIETNIPNTDTLAGTYQIYSDLVTDGQQIEYPLQRPTFVLGDTVDVSLFHINEVNYDYFNTANNILKNRKGPMASASAPQSNPLTNISGDALGYFGTFSVSSKRVIIK